MKNWKRFLTLLLALTLVLGMMPHAQAKSGMEAHEMTEADYAAADAIYEALWSADSVQSAEASRKGQAVYNTLLHTDGVADGTVRFQGPDRVVWETEEGVACVWSSWLEEIAAKAEPMDTDMPDEVTVDFSTRGVNHGVDVYVVQPYYGIDSSFTTQYADEGKRVAQVTGGTYYYKKATAATIDYVAEAIASGGVVFFDSHGDTDYTNYNDRDDHVSGAVTSYLLLQTGNGLTSADYAYDYDKGTYHAAYGGSYGSMKYYEVDGTAIANHMTKNSNNGLLWAAICLGMATDGLHAPLRAKGLGVAYGYSQSVSFDGDYCFEEAFYNSLCAGKTVAESIADMKATYGNWDASPQIAAACGWPSYWAYETEEEARADYAAFPILVSNEDPYPGHGNVDTLQNVYSTWKLIDSGSAPCVHDYVLTNAQEATCTEPGYTGDQVCSKCGDTIPGEVIPALGHDMVYDGTSEPTCEENGYTWYRCTRCNAREITDSVPALGHDLQFMNYVAPTCTELGHGYDEACARCGEIFNLAPEIPALGHEWSEWVTVQKPTATEPGLKTRSCSRCGVGESAAIPFECPSASFTDVGANAWYHEAVDFVVYNGLMNGMSATSFAPNDSMTRAMLVTVLWRFDGSMSGCTGSFTDVPAGTWYTEAVAWAAENGIVNGTGNGKFSPNAKITREQMAAILYRYADFRLYSTSARGDLSSFPDAASVHSYAYDAMSWAVAEGFITGSTVGGKAYLLPTGNATRAQVAAILMRFVNKYGI